MERPVEHKKLNFRKALKNELLYWVLIFILLFMIFFLRVGRLTRSPVSRYFTGQRANRLTGEPNKMRAEDAQWYRDEYYCLECQCGRAKKSGFSFCWKCWHKLPEELQIRLYNKRGAWTTGYGQAYEECVRFLNE